MEEKALGYATELFLRISEEKRTRIIAMAVEEFAAFGYAGANVNRIAQAAGISVGALYKFRHQRRPFYVYRRARDCHYGQLRERYLGRGYPLSL